MEEEGNQDNDCSTTNQLGVMSSKEKSVIVDSTNQIDEDGLTNFVLTVAGVSAVVLLLRSDVKQSANIFRCNVKHIRNWLEEETAASSK
ncbi:hypothetical protein Ahy_B04g069181 [Arachis hypogaea]|uniref:Uncharacterized protein n=1 Tax=Arachis hypogaea TaxID=3818 RepID=A0A444ZBW8_ARAHY|nr:hypothetical protein Ahy_B04g069181 [Arachis hypogaea]